MSAIVVIAKAVGLIVLALLLFSGLAAALDVDLAAAKQGACVGRPITSCFLTII